ncbi:MAG TPA: Uma2 family endonuclease [Pseudonocardiaceae bacterium]|nr:Uma2 family endonuclease [Pseudonocardiaceae bacterium]
MTVGASSPFTVHDLEGMPDDGRRYELIDGELLVSPAPGLLHQRVAFRLARVLDDACPDELEVIIAPFAVRPDNCNELQPDVLVARRGDLTDRHLPSAPVLAVEVYSPSSRLVDANLKRAAYARLGVPSYWLVDPVAPSVTVLRLAGSGEYRQVAHVAGEEAVDLDAPFPVRVRPVDLTAQRRRLSG